MGLQYNVQVLHSHGGVTGFSGDIKTSDLDVIPFITGKSFIRVTEEGWSQLVGYSTASRFLQIYGCSKDWERFKGRYAGEMYRITIA